MKSFYTILYATINPVIQEQIGIGLILTGKDTVYFNYSTDKLSHITSFYPNSAYQLLKDSLKNIQNTVNQTIEKKEVDALNLKVEGLKDKVFTQEYIDYLARYNKNLLTFSRPKQIDIEPNEHYFNKLFEKYIFKTEKEEIIKEIRITDVVRKNLYPKIEKRVNLDKELSKNEIDTLWMPVNVNFIGQNDDAVIGKAIDFQKRNYTIEAELGHLAALIKAFDDKKKHAKYYVMADEPDKKLDKQHILWKDIAKTNYIDMVPTNEIDKIAEYIEEKDVQPFTNIKK